MHAGGGKLLEIEHLDYVDAVLDQQDDVDRELRVADGARLQGVF